MGPGTQLGAAGTQIHIFDFSGPKKVLYTSWGGNRGLPSGCPGVAVGHPSPRPEQNRRVSIISISATLHAYFASFRAYFTHGMTFVSFRKPAVS